MTGDKYVLKNGFWINSKGTTFDLLLNDSMVMLDCTNFSYVSNALIITKKKNVITIFSAFPTEDQKPNVLASFSNKNPNIFANVILNGICYTVDYNCQVTTSRVNRKLYPKIN